MLATIFRKKISLSNMELFIQFKNNDEKRNK